jgi:mRNA interferase YafQ
MSEFKYVVVESATFKKKRKLARKRGLDMALLEEAVRILAKGEALPLKYRDHPLQGRFAEFRECHIKGDWLLVYRMEEGRLMLFLHSTGTHADLFE